MSTEGGKGTRNGPLDILNTVYDTLTHRGSNDTELQIRSPSPTQSEISVLRVVFSAAVTVSRVLA